MKSILIVSDDFHNAVSFYRVAGPFGRLKHDYPGAFHFQLAQNISWADISLHDILFVSRPHTDNHLKIMEIARKLGKPIWIDYDDDLTDVPVSNPAHTLIMAKKIQENIGAAMNLASIMSVSTGYLAERYSKVKKAVVIRNAIDDRVMPIENKCRYDAQIAFWRGTASHDKDLGEYIHCVKEVACQMSGADFIFSGNPSWQAMDLIPSAQKIPPLIIVEYLHALRTIGPKVMQVPLWDCAFNRAKSNIAYLEGCSVGAVTMAPRWEEWDLPGVLTYDSGPGYMQKLQWVLSMPEAEHRAIVKAGQDHIRENFVLPLVNRARKKILDDLM